jgi:hypothetical protein
MINQTWSAHALQSLSSVAASLARRAQHAWSVLADQRRTSPRSACKAAVIITGSVVDHVSVGFRGVGTVVGRLSRRVGGVPRFRGGAGWWGWAWPLVSRSEKGHPRWSSGSTGRASGHARCVGRRAFLTNSSGSTGTAHPGRPVLTASATGSGLRGGRHGRGLVVDKRGWHRRRDDPWSRALTPHFRQPTCEKANVEQTNPVISPVSNATVCPQRSTSGGPTSEWAQNHGKSPTSSQASSSPIEDAARRRVMHR